MAARRPLPLGDAPRGQHALRSRSLADLLVADAGVEPGDLVVDVGAGAGAVTRALLRAGARVIAVEREPSLVATLGEAFGGRPDVRVVAADVRSEPWPSEPFHVASNLPFAAAATVLGSLLEPAVPLVGAALIVQWEQAVKQTAPWPSTLRSVYWGAWHELRLVRRISASAFAPPPSVSAGVLRVRRRHRPLVAPARAPAYAALLRRGFGEQRSLRRALPPLVGSRTVARIGRELGFAPDARARDLDAHQWVAVFEHSLD